MMFYETAAQAIGDTVSGRDLLVGPVGARGAGVDHSTGLESRFMGEVAHIATDLSTEEANEIIGKIYSRYENMMQAAPPGKAFSECYIVNSEYDMRPIDEYIELYTSIIGEIKEYCGVD